MGVGADGYEDSYSYVGPAECVDRREGWGSRPGGCWEGYCWEEGTPELYTKNRRGLIEGTRQAPRA